MPRSSFWALLLLATPIMGFPAAAAAAEREFGFGRAEVTPREPNRLSGYAARGTPAEGAVHKLWARACAIKDEGGRLYVLAAADCIGFPGAMTTQIARELERRHGLPREAFVLAATHSHTAPHVAGGLTNIFTVPLTPEEEAAANRYAEQLQQGVLAAVDAAIKDLGPGTLSWAQGSANFAANRRAIKNGRWEGFGVDPKGPVDRSVPVLQVRGPDGQVRGIVFNYACHCTTLGPEFNQVCGDWAAFAAEELEGRYPKAVAICTIGCGADQNPEPRTGLDLSRQHGRELSRAVADVVEGPQTPIKGTLSAGFTYAGLPIDRPTVDELKERLTSGDVHVRRHAQTMLDIYERMGRLPETYPCPVQVWRFGDDLGMVFLGGEVVVDYVLRLKRELGPGKVWATAYANDVFGYVASERVRSEGGYEVDSSMIYYSQPGRWSTGTEELLIKTIKELWANPSVERAKTPAEGLQSWKLPPEFEIELVAAEPLVADPINLAFGADGKLWVVEMGDYPRGEDDHGSPGGRVRWLEDADGDGQFEKSVVFLEGLEFPTAVYPWRDGVLVAAAPELLHAADTDGDGRADRRTVLFDGFQRGNPQHRFNGFDYGLDGWIYAGGGSEDREIRSLKTGETTETHGRDFRFQPDLGLIEPLSGQSGFVRSRDDFGRWFCGDNSRPIRHSVLPDHYLRRNPFAAYPQTGHDLCDPPLNPPVFPASRTRDRFNDLYTANRFTSACSPVIYRADLFGPDYASAAFVCEPVHNLVHRVRVIPDGATFRGERFAADASSEFLASTDPWARPVRVVTGPDGALWIADMYRLVIEHPAWIPEEWQRRIDLRAGHEKGRIYRVFPRGKRPSPWPKLAAAKREELVASLASSVGPLRDMAQRLLIERRDDGALSALEDLGFQTPDPRVRVQSLAVRAALGAQITEPLAFALRDPHAEVRRFAIELAEACLAEQPGFGPQIVVLADDADAPVRLQAAFSLGGWNDPSAAPALAKAALRAKDDPWLTAAVQSVSPERALSVAEALWQRDEGEQTDSGTLVEGLLASALGADPLAASPAVLSAALAQSSPAPLAAVLQTLERRGCDPSEVLLRLGKHSTRSMQTLLDRLEQARQTAANAESPVELRIAQIPLLGHLAGEARRADVVALVSLLNSREELPLQLAAVERLGHIADDSVAPALLADWAQLAPAVRQRALDALLGRPAWTEALLNAAETGGVRLAELDAARRDRLLTHPAEAIRVRAAKLIASPAHSDRQALVERYRGQVAEQGDAERGRALFKQHCAACHRLGSEGHAVGPDLASLSNKSNEALLVAVLDPNRAVEWHYKVFHAVTKDGRLHAGMVAEEASGSVTLAAADGQRTVLLRSELEELRETEKSLMPEGLEASLGASDLSDVFSFLRSPAR